MNISEDDLNSSIYMTLNSTPASSDASKLINEIFKRIVSTSGRAFRRNRKLSEAVGAIVADLIRAAMTDLKQYSYLPMAAGSFTDHRLGYTVVKRAFDGLSAADLIVVLTGMGGGAAKAWATRFRATPALLRLADEFGIQPANWAAHFESLPRPESIAHPIVLRNSSKVSRGRKHPGRSLLVDLSKSPAKEIAAEVNALNSFFASVRIEPADCHYAFQRIFNQADTSAFAWNKGGRLISMGNSYQQMGSTERAKIRLNDEPVVEIDIRASHLTILHAKLGISFDRTKSDPYDIPTLPREITKAWVTMTLGYDHFQTRWSKENKSKYKERFGKDLQKDYPIKAVRETVLTNLPVLKDWPSCGIRWGDLQYIESQVLVETMTILAVEHGIPALPVHDSIIVPKSSEAIARKVLTSAFKNFTGTEPHLTSK